MERRHMMKKATSIRIAVVLATVAAAMTAMPSAHAATVTQSLCAKAGSTTLPGGATLPVYGYVANCADAVTKPGGPVITANAGDTVEVTLTNNLGPGKQSAVLFDGQAMAPDLTGIANGGTTTYSFTASQPGTYLYEAGLLPNTQYQTALGLYGVLVVNPGAPGQAYDDAATAYEVATPVVLGEIDPALNNTGDPSAFDLRNYRPRYWTINGVAFDSANPDANEVVVAAGDRVLLRYANAGLLPHSMGVLNGEQTILSSDGGRLNVSPRVVANSLAPGETADALVDVPGDSPAGTRIAVMDTTSNQHNANQGVVTAQGRNYDFGGMMFFLRISGTGGGTGGPATSNTTASPNPAASGPVSITATVDPSATGAEYFIDATGADGAGEAMTVAAGTATGSIPDADALSGGPHTIYVHATDGSTWGAFDFETLQVDKTGPSVYSLSVTPQPSNGTIDVVLKGTADETAAGGSNVAGASYQIDTGPWVGMAVTPEASKVAQVSATIPAATINALTPGTHLVSVVAEDSLGNSTAMAGTVTLTVDKAGPVASGLTATPNPTNGKIGVSSSNLSVRVSGVLTDDFSAVKAGEGFIDTVGANGSGFPLFPSDGVFNASPETGYADIPLTTINQLTEGNHTIFLHGKDAAGNWGTTTSIVVRVDRTAPSVTSVSASPNPTNTTTGTNTVFVLTASATDTGAGATNLVGAEWFEGTDPGVGQATAITSPSDLVWNSTTEGITVTVPFYAQGWALGNHTVSVRFKDAAGNWSAASSTTVTIVYPNPIFSNGFETGSSPWGWSSSSGGGRLTTQTAAQMPVIFGSTRGLQVSLCTTPATTCNSTLTSYVTDNSPVADAGYHARFYVNPHGASLGGRVVTVFAGYTGNNGGGTQAFRVEMQQSGATTYQVRMVLARTNGAAQVGPWITVNNASNWVEIDWLGTNASGAKAHIVVNGAAAVTVGGTGTTSNTGAYSLSSVRLGVIGWAGTTSNHTGSIWFDTFASTRRTAIGA